MTGTIECAFRNAPPGSVVERRALYEFGTYERIVARPGPFSAHYLTYVIVMAQGPLHGHVQLNGTKLLAGPTADAVYSVLRPNDHVAGSFAAETRYEVLLLDAGFVDRLIQTEVGESRAYLASSLRVEVPPMLQSIWRRLRLCVDQDSPLVSAVARVCVELLLVKLVEGQVAAPSPADARENIQAVKRAVDFIDARLAESLDVKSIAQAAQLSPYYFSRVFRAAYQTSVHRFVLERRLSRARQMLAETEQSIAVIALETGFSSQSHLTTAFRQRYGATPAHYRTTSLNAERDATLANKATAGD